MTEHREPSVWERLRSRLGTAADEPSGRIDAQAQAEKLAARSRGLRSRIQATKAAGIPLVFLAFHTAGHRYGVPIDDVLEVQTLERYTPVPYAPSFIPGVIPWRGTILALLDPGKLLGVVDTGIADVHSCIIVEAADRRIALVTGEIDDIHDVPRHEVKPVPKLPGEVPQEWMIGVHDEDRLIFRMDTILQDPRLEAWKN